MRGERTRDGHERARRHPSSNQPLVYAKRTRHHACFFYDGSEINTWNINSQQGLCAEEMASGQEADASAVRALFAA